MYLLTSAVWWTPSLYLYLHTLPMALVVDDHEIKSELLVCLHSLNVECWCDLFAYFAECHR